MKKCEKCGAVLVPGENWYTMKPDYVCCNCSNFPYYPDARTNVNLNTGDYEEAILARQEEF